MSLEPLNLFLYNKLEQIFGKVIIANQGEAMIGHHVYQNGRKQWEVANPGEYYRVQCEYCNDHKHRLWINHRWGVGMSDDPHNPLWWMLVCYNEHCYEGEENYYRRRDLERQVYADMRSTERNRIPIIPGELNYELHRVEDPGVCLLVDQLPMGHKANRYLLERGFDPIQLAQQYRVMYCQEADPKHYMAQGRLVIPIYMRGDYVGYQCRYIGEADWHTVSKYWNTPGFSKRMALYNFDNAKLSPLVVITEGVTDVWRVGGPCISLFGKTISTQQMELILRNWRYAVLMLDSDALEESMDTYNKMRNVIRTIHVQLPEGADPGSIPTDDLWQIIGQNCYQQGLNLDQIVQTMTV